MRTDRIKSKEIQISPYEAWKNQALRIIHPNTPDIVSFNGSQDKKFLELMDYAPMVVLIINHAKSSYEYCSKNVFQLLGYTSEEMLEGGVALGTSFVAEEHHQAMSEGIIPAMFEHLENHRAHDLKKIRISYNFKTKRKDGNIIWLLQQMSVVETDSLGAPTVSMFFMLDITHIKKDELLDFTVSMREDTGYFRPLFTTTFPNAKEVITFTARELDILKLINLGLHTLGIAEKLSISIHTVNTHRKNIIKKLRKTSSFELLNTLKMKGLID